MNNQKMIISILSIAIAITFTACSGEQENLVTDQEDNS